MAIKFPQITLSSGDIDFIEDVVEFLQEILDAVSDEDATDE